MERERESVRVATTKSEGNSKEDTGAPSIFDTLRISGLERCLCSDIAYLTRYSATLECDGLYCGRNHARILIDFI